jgi:CRISPR/Cas system-associated endonuclease Cas1
MIKRSIEISRNPAHICLKSDQIILKHGDTVLGTIPSEDLGILVVDHPQTTFSASALARIAEQGGAVVLCDRSHLPIATLVPHTRHCELLWRVNDQIDATAPRKKRIWQAVINAKIHAQASLLDQQSPACRKLKALATKVKSGDADSHESQAARIYWSNWLTSHLPPQTGESVTDGITIRKDPPYIAPRIPIDTLRTTTYDDEPELLQPELGEPHGTEDLPLSAIDLWATAKAFRRNPDHGGLNAFLNYGYAILRAVTARSLASAGLNPALGIQHAHRGNPFCLADDLMEPLRPIVDRRVRMLWCEQGKRTLDPQTKTVLLDTLTETVRFNGTSGPLMVVMGRYVNSFYRCLQGTDQKLHIPKMLP